jgi:hypothetical protein
MRLIIVIGTRKSRWHLVQTATAGTVPIHLITRNRPLSAGICEIFLQSQMAHHTVFSSFKLMHEQFVAEKAIRQFEDVARKGTSQGPETQFPYGESPKNVSDVGLGFPV